MRTIVPCLWFDTEAEGAANHYVSLFRDSRVLGITRCGEGGPRPAGTVLTVQFELAGHEFLALNGGPEFSFNEAVSFQVMCESQDEVDEFWAALATGGEEGPCGWVKDRFGLSWQIVPTALPELLQSEDPDRVRRVTEAFMGMTKLDIAALQKAAAG